MRWRLGLAALLTLCLGVPGAADPVRRVNLVELSQGAATILSGRVVRVQEEVDADGTPVRVISLRVKEVLKSEDRGRRGRPSAGNAYQFRQWNHPVLRRTHLRMPQYTAGEDVVLFLAGTSSAGLTSPLALEQGKFTIRTFQKRNRVSRVLSNGRDNANLPVVDPFETVTPQARATRLRSELARVSVARLTPAEQDILTRSASGPLSYETFVSLVKKLVRTGRRGG
jgi:hypothetical protein